MSVITAIKSNYGKYLARGAGAAALYFIARDAHNFGKIRSDIEVQSKNAKAAQYFLEYSSSFFQLFVKFFERSPPDESLAPGPPAKPPDGFAAFSFL